jgi:hypothetical protein
MPEDVKLVERAVNEGWPLERIARQLKRDPDEAAAISEAFRAAREAVDAPTPAESFAAPSLPAAATPTLLAAATIPS